MEPEPRLITWPMVAIFMLVFSLATIARLPAATMLPYLHDGGIQAAGAEGTVWNARFTGLSYQVMQFDQGSYKLTPQGLISGEGLGRFALIGELAALNGRLLGLGDNRIHLGDLKINAKYPLTIRRLKMNPQISMQTDRLVLSQDGQCVDGDISLNLKLNNTLLTGFLPQADLWDGSASCDAGRASFLLNPRDTTLIAVIRGTLNGNRYQAQIDLSLEDGFDESPGLTAALKSAGFKKRKGRWQTEIKGIL